MTTIYDFTARRLDGTEQPLSAYSGDVLLVVNTASKCGFTPQYEGLETLQKTYAGRGFSVLGFPCNQFGGQEPGDAAAIGAFCQLTYDVTFPMFAKIDVNGDGAHPLYARHGRDQVEVHQVPDRPRRRGARQVRADHQAGSPGRPDRGVALTPAGHIALGLGQGYGPGL